MNVCTRKSNHLFRLLALFAICFLGATIAWAAPAETRSMEVSFRDLDLSTQSGAVKLYRRIHAAARG
ncbi:MAG TPA: UrcA family protein, partial [Steroidobacteraceae bacterium]